MLYVNGNVNVPGTCVDFLIASEDALKKKKETCDFFLVISPDVGYK